MKDDPASSPPVAAGQLAAAAWAAVAVCVPAAEELSFAPQRLRYRSRAERSAAGVALAAPQRGASLHRDRRDDERGDPSKGISAIAETATPSALA